jgi:hypothetical protein
MRERAASLMGDNKDRFVVTAAQMFCSSVAADRLRGTRPRANRLVRTRGVSENTCFCAIQQKRFVQLQHFGEFLPAL